VAKRKHSGDLDEMLSSNAFSSAAVCDYSIELANLDHQLSFRISHTCKELDDALPYHISNPHNAVLSGCPRRDSNSATGLQRRTHYELTQLPDRGDQPQPHTNPYS
jgi:hypothetical protein